MASIMQLNLLKNFLAATLLLAALNGCAPAGQQSFDSPEAAIQALADLIADPSDEGVERLFGPGSLEFIRSGDDEADRDDYQRVRAMILEAVAFEPFDDNTLIPLLGASEWPWPVPLTRADEGWRFDSDKGREELLNRRIGNNELWTLTALHEVVEAQREYRSQPRDGNSAAFAGRFRSTEGKQDGLYWPTAEGEELSPLGELVGASDAVARGDEGPQPFHGYFYRMLTRRGPSAPGGELDYADDQGLLTRGFAVLAWPANYGNSGVMTFMTDQRGIVFEKDLGPDTATAVASIESFDPDASWSPTADRVPDEP